MSSKKNLKAYLTVSKNRIGHNTVIYVLGMKKQPWGLLFCLSKKAAAINAAACMFYKLIQFHVAVFNPADLL